MSFTWTLSINRIICVINQWLEMEKSREWTNFIRMNVWLRMFHKHFGNGSLYVRTALANINKKWICKCFEMLNENVTHCLNRSEKNFDIWNFYLHIFEVCYFFYRLIEKKKWNLYSMLFSLVTPIVFRFPGNY